MGIVDGRVVVVTGAGRGIGRAHALAFAAEGAHVVVNDIGTGPANEVVDEITSAGGEAVVNRDDIADWDGASSLIQTAVNTFGGLDVLVNNAGFIRGSDLADTSEAEWDAVICVHLKGHFTMLLVGEQSQSDLGEALRVDRTNLVGLLNDLEAANLIERRRSPQDRRRHTVSLTPEGTRRLAEVENALTEAEQRVLAVLDSEQQATLHALLEQVTANAVVCSEQQNADRATGSAPGRRG